MTQYFSDKLRVMSFIAIINVLYIHSGFHSDEIEDMIVNDNVQILISEMLGRCAVPLFYIISGYLFFIKVPNGMKSILNKILKRMRTLLIPYLIGCLFFVIFLVVVEVVPGTKRFMNGSVMPMFSLPLEEILCSIFYDTGNGSPCAFQLWFLRDLIIIVAISPLCFLCLKWLGWWFVTFVFALTFCKVPYVPVYALFWFILGGQLSRSENMERRHGMCQILCLITFVIVSLVQLIFPTLIKWELLHIPIILLGIIGIWNLYNIIVGENFVLIQHKCLATACQFTFFIYLFHEPTLNIVRKLIVVLLGKNEIGYLTSYILSPWIFTFFAVVAGLLFRKYFPKVYNLCTGRR